MRVEIIVSLVVGLVVRRRHEVWSDAKETKGPECTWTWGGVTLSLSFPLNYVREQCFQQLSAVQWYLFGHLTAHTPTHAEYWIGRRLKTAFRRPPFYDSTTFPIFICYSKSPTHLPPLVRRYRRVDVGRVGVCIRCVGDTEEGDRGVGVLVYATMLSETP